MLKTAARPSSVRAIRVIARVRLFSHECHARLIGEFAARPEAPAQDPSSSTGSPTATRGDGTGRAGLSNGEIASRLVVSPATSQDTRQPSMRKLGAHDRAQLVVLDTRRGSSMPGHALAAAVVRHLGAAACCSRRRQSELERVCELRRDTPRFRPRREARQIDIRRGARSGSGRGRVVEQARRSLGPSHSGPETRPGRRPSLVPCASRQTSYRRQHQEVLDDQETRSLPLPSLPTARASSACVSWSSSSRKRSARDVRSRREAVPPCRTRRVAEQGDRLGNSAVDGRRSRTRTTRRPAFSDEEIETA